MDLQTTLNLGENHLLQNHVLLLLLLWLIMFAIRITFSRDISSPEIYVLIVPSLTIVVVIFHSISLYRTA